MFTHEYVGNIHIHSRYSDGIGGIDSIARSAAGAGLDFICLNDHDYMMESLPLGEEGFYGNVLVLVGMEIGRRYHHYLAYNIQEKVSSDNLEPQEVISQVNRQGGLGFLAHPFEKGMPFKERAIAYTWNDLTVKGYNGLCLWNFASRWKERIKGVFHGIFFLSFKSQTLKGPSRETISFWDSQCQKRRVIAVGGSDAHGSLFKLGPVSFIPLSYDFMFRAINIHLLLNRKISKDFKEAKKEIYEAMREGRLFIAHDRLSPANGFRFYFLSDDGSDLIMGEEDYFHKGNLLVELPDYGEIRILKDGLIVKRLRGLETVYRARGRGVYRVEVYRRLPIFGWRPWIFSNPIYLR